MSGSLHLIYDAVISKERKDMVYWIPERWITNKDVVVLERKDKLVKVEPYNYLKTQIDSIVSKKKDGVDYHSSLSKIKGHALEGGKIIKDSGKRTGGDWLAGSNIYGIYIRSFTSFDHDQDGILGGDKNNITLNAQGVKETGTFLKAIALVPYIKSLGFNTIYTLPVSLSGKAHKKGELGSPYGIRNPFQIDPVFHDTLVDEFDVEMEFRAFMEAAHIMGLRVLVDFGFRITSRDSDFVKEHPNWFYWIDKAADANYHSPEFSREELDKIHIGVNEKAIEMLPPHDDYIDLFTAPPLSKDIKHIDDDTGYVGIVDGKEVLPPGAFADWPPDDIQPPWTDATYLKLYEDEAFNYVAYNTIRMYDGRIRKENSALWDTLANIIPFYQEEFGIDGARVDMGHALPKKLERLIIENARKEDPDFGFLSENFNVKAPARKAGYNAVFGNMWFALPRVDQGNHNNESFAKSFIKDLPDNPNPALGCPETADTPRAAARRGGVKFSKAAWVLVNTLPNVIPFCHAGFELGDRKPTNLGLDFTADEIKVMSKEPLAFFDRAALSWNSVYAEEVTNVIKTINDFREDNLGALLHIDNFQLIDTEVDGKPTLSKENPVVAYIREFQEQIITLLTSGIFGELLYPVEIENDYLIVVNLDCENEVIASLKIGKEMLLCNIFNKTEYKTVNNELNLKLKPGEYLIAVSI